MAVSDEVQITMGAKRGPTCASYCKDFANMLKAFIGSNYLTIAFAFYQSGLLLGLAGVFLIASVTAHCCNLLVKCKYHAIKRMLMNAEDKGHTQESSCEQRYYTYDEMNSSSSIEERFEEDLDKENARYKKLLRSMSYGDVGHLCFGKTGLALVNTAIIITQFGFCIGYCIFIGNTIQSMIPMYNCSIPVNASAPSDLDHCTKATSLRIPHIANQTVINSFKEATTQDTMMQNWLEITLSPFSTLNSSAVSFNSTTTTTTTSLSTSNSTLSTTSLNTSPNSTLSTTSLSTSNSTLSTTSLSTSPNSTFSPTANTTTSIPWSDLSRWVLTRKINIDLKLLVLFPVPIFIFAALIRNLRTMGLISLAANAAIMLGCIEVLYFLISGFELSDSFVLVNWKGMSIFFGLVTGAFEGIGTILPIEASMEGNRHNFTKYLYGAVTILAVVLTCFGVLGYLHFGHDVRQMINANIPSGDVLNMFVNVSLCLGVLLTFPLMIFPVIQLAEGFFLGSDGICGSKQDKEMEGERQSLLPPPDDESADHGGKVSSKNIASWKRNILRITLVSIAAGFAVLLRNYFAYIAAFVGALGSTMLAYILPCLFHLKLCWSELPAPIKIKDIIIIIMGICCGVAGMYSVLHEIIG